MLRSLTVALAILAVGALPSAALAKTHTRAHAHKATHAKKHRARTRTAARSVSDPGTTITDPGTTITDPGTTITDPGTTITDPGTTVTPPTGNPSQQCRDEENDDAFEETHGEDFAHFYGTNHNLRNAFGKCVSQHAQDQDDDEGDDGEGSDD
jgi:hypothetical protein